jgi:predicted amidohydrolase YtcJ
MLAMSEITTADVIIRNARITTLNPAAPQADTMAIKDGRVLALGSLADIHNAHHGSTSVVYDMAGACVMPGLHDAHNHHQIGGKADLMEVTFLPTTTLDDILEIIRTYASTLDPGAWIVGGSWGSTLLTQLSAPGTLARLDEASGHHPALLVDDSHHNKWANSAALRLAGITGATVDPVDGRIERSPDGTPTGVLLETAGVMVEKIMTEANRLTSEQWADTSLRGIEILHRYGVTAFQDAGASIELMTALRDLDNTGRLSAWAVSCMMANDMIFGADPVGDGLVWGGEAFRTEHHRPDFIKIFLDGIPPTRTACFLEPYLPDEEHGAHHLGHTAMPASELTDWLIRAAEKGLAAKVHCTGDASVRHVLDAVEKMRARGLTETAVHIAHGQFVALSDIPRMADLNVTAEISPTLWFPGVIYEAIKLVLGEERAQQMQPNRSLLSAGAVVIGGSDWPVIPLPNPWPGIEGLITRADPTGEFDGTLGIEQALSLDEAIAVYTTASSQAMGLGELTGSLEPGKSADFIVLDRDPWNIAITDIGDTVVLQTWFAGKKVYEL